MHVITEMDSSMSYPALLDENGDISVSAFLSHILRMSFSGRICVNLREYSVKPCPRYDIPVTRGYFSGRLNRYSASPINATCKDNLHRLFVFVFENGRPDQVSDVSLGLVRAFGNVSLLEDDVLRACSGRFQGFPLSKDESSFLLCLVDVFAEATQDRQAVDRLSLKRRIHERLSQQNLVRAYTDAERMKQENGGVSFFASNNEVGYPGLLLGAQTTVDIVNVHGSYWLHSWTDDISAALQRAGLRIRVVFLDPRQSGRDEPNWFDSYCLVSGENRDKLRNHISTSIERWQGLYRDAIENDVAHAELQLFYGKWFPAVSLYRFDEEIIVRLSNNTKKHFDYAFRLSRGQVVHQRDAYLDYRKVIDEVFRGAEAIPFVDVPNV